MDPRHTKNPSGAWLQRMLSERNEGALATLMVATGFLMGFLLRGLPTMDGFMRAFPIWAVAACGAVLIGTFLAVVLAYVRRTQATWGAGWAAERRVGDRIEHALVRPDCAFAHDVREVLGGGGNVDHVVLTPAGVWVVETKASWLEPERFQKALQQAARNAQRLREHLATQIPVRAALVIADSEEPYEHECDWLGEEVIAFRLVSFWQRLGTECKSEAADGSEQKKLRQLVWNLGSTAHLNP